MTNDKLVNNLINIINELPCQGIKGKSTGRCHQVNCLRCQALDQVEANKAKDITPLKEKLKGKFTNMLSWFKFGGKKKTDYVVAELKKLGFFKDDN